MIIKEVPAEGNLTIEVSLKERKLEFHSQCVESGVNYIYANPIRIDGKILSFNSEGHLMVNLIYLREEKNPIVWKGVGITTVQNNGKNVYKIVASGEGFEMNRRESFRLFLGLGAVVQIGSNKMTFRPSPESMQTICWMWRYKPYWKYCKKGYSR